MAALRSQDHYKAATRELRAAGYDWTEHHGGVHSYLAVEVNGRVEKVTVADSPSDVRAAVNAATDIRRRIRKWKAEADAVRVPASAASMTLEVGGTMNHMPAAAALTMSSREIADLCETRHNQVASTIARLFEKGVLRESRNTLRRFQPEGGGRPIEVYDLTKRDTLVVASGYRDDLRARIIDRWIELESAGGSAVAAVRPTAVSDDTEAMLSMLADIRLDLIRAHQSSAGTALEHIDGAKAAVLHYLKAYLREPADSFHEDVRHRNVAAYKRDHQIITAVNELNRQIGDLIALAGPAISERPFLWSEWFDTARIYTEHFPERVIPKKGFLSMAIAKGLDSHCKQTRAFHHMEQRVVGGHPRNFWHRNAVWAWLEAGGRDVVEGHIARHMPSAEVVHIARVVHG